MTHKKSLKHGSSGDWNFDTGDWILDSTRYVSSPSSLHFTTTNKALVKVTTVPIANVKEGRVVTQVYMNNADEAALSIYFRFQDDSNYYRVQIGGTAADYHTIIKVKGGSSTVFRQGTSSWLPVNTWGKVRVTWWNDYVGLVIRIEYWNGSAWVKILEDAFDSYNEWEDIGGRVGIGHVNARALYWWIDDTEIYGIG